jgi:capsular exopolysaccharide synthesis family protein
MAEGIPDESMNTDEGELNTFDGPEPLPALPRSALPGSAHPGRALPRRSPARMPRQSFEAADSNWPDVATAAPPDEAASIDLRALWHAFLRRWMLAMGLGIVGSVLAGAGGWFLLEPHYTATGYLRIASSEPTLVSYPGDQLNTAQFDIYKRTQRELILGRYVLNTALSTPKAAELPRVQRQLDPVTWLAKEIKVAFPGEAEIMTISMSGESAQEIAALVNAVLDAYQQEVVLVEKNQRMAKLNKLEELARLAEEKSRLSRANLRRLADTLGTGDSQALTLKQQIALQRYATMLGEHTRVQIALMQADIELATAEARQGSAEDIALPADELRRFIDADANLVALRARLKAFETLHADSKETVAPGRHQDRIDRHGQKVDDARRALAEAEEKVRVEAASAIREKLAAQAAANVTLAHNELLLLKSQEEKLKTELESLSDEAGKIGRSSIDVEMMRAEIVQLDEIARRLGGEIEKIRIELQSPSRITLLSRAEVPAFKDVKPQIKGAAGLAFLGFVLPIFGICWRDARARPVSPVVGARHLAGIRVLGALPLVQPPRTLGGAGRRALLAQQNRMAFRESIDALRTTLLREAELAHTQMVMVTSAACGEGKTSVACQLALSIARARRRCLLVDFDLRRPAAHRALDLPAEQGICEVLRGELSIDDVIRPTSTADLSFIAAGAYDDEALVALTQRRLPECLAALRERFEFIIVDSSPILPVVDAVLVGKHVDAAVLSVLCNVSQTPKIENAYARLDAMGVHVLGIVVTGPQGSLVYDPGAYQYVGPRAG